MLSLIESDKVQLLIFLFVVVVDLICDDLEKSKVGGKAQDQ